MQKFPMPLMMYYMESLTFAMYGHMKQQGMEERGGTLISEYIPSGLYTITGDHLKW